jgi:hypothetical protein
MLKFQQGITGYKVIHDMFVYRIAVASERYHANIRTEPI